MCKSTGKQQAEMKKRNDDLHPGSYYANWFDDERRVIRNAQGPLGDPEGEPDWSLLHGNLQEND